MTSAKTRSRIGPTVGAATRNIIIFVAALSIPLAAAVTLDLTEGQTSSWIMVLYGLSGILSIVLTVRYRQPLLLTANIFVIIFITRLGSQLPYPQIIGAATVAGAAVLLAGLFGISRTVASWVPMPIIFGLLAGAVFSFVVDIFDQMGEAPLLVGGTFVAYLLSRALLGERIPAIFPAVAAGVAIAAVTGQFGPLPSSITLVVPEITWPAFSLSAIVSASTIFLVLITFQANLPAMRFLQGQHYDPPETVIDVVSGIGTMVGSLLGPVGVSLSLPATSVVAGSQAGPHEQRHRAVYLVAGAAILIGLLASVATDVAEIIPRALLLALAGLALINVLGEAIGKIGEGPLLAGPLFTFVVAVSDISLLGFGSFFWALVIGMSASLLLEREELLELRTAVAD